MNDCLELIYDYFGIEFYPMDDVTFSKPMMVREKFVNGNGVSINTPTPYLSVGNFPTHSYGKIRANDDVNNVTTTVKEKFNNAMYEVEIHFEFKRADSDNVRLCERLDAAPYHIVLNRFHLDGQLADRRIIRNGEGNSRTSLTEMNGVINVDIKIANVSGIQMIG